MATVDDGIAMLEKLCKRLSDVPTPAGPTPRKLVELLSIALFAKLNLFSDAVKILRLQSFLLHQDLISSNILG